jgi:hypothetical protein
MIGLHCQDMTCLRYLIPIYKKLSGAQKKCLMFVKTSAAPEKYNSFYQNSSRIIEVLQENNIVAYDMNDAAKIKLSTLITIETIGHDHYEYDNHLAVGHGFDCWNFGKKVADLENTKYIFHNQEVADFALSEYGAESIVVETPVVFWGIEDTFEIGKKYLSNLGIDPDNDRIATIFYPDKDYQDDALQVYKGLREKGYKVLVKQRRKYQGINSNIENKVYDSIWYPTEAAILPVFSDVNISFGSSCFLECSFLKSCYINNLCPAYSRDYVVPQSQHIHTNVDDFVKSTLKQVRDYGDESLSFYKARERHSSINSDVSIF